MVKQESQDRLISIKEVALLLGIGVSTAWAWTGTKEGFPVPIRFSSRCTRFPLSEVETFKNSYLAGRLH